jgi:hypothetical protein
VPPRRRRPRVNRHFKIDHDLRPEDRDAYLARLREPRTTIDVAHAWLAEHGYRGFSRSAVARHRRHYLEAFERRERIADAAMQFAALARDGRFSAEGLILGMAAQSEALLFTAMLDRPAEGEALTLKELDELGRLVSVMVKTRQQVFELERQIESAGRPTSSSAIQAAAAPAPTPEEQRETTVRRICEILNYPYPPPGSKAKPPTPGLEGFPNHN